MKVQRNYVSHTSDIIARRFPQNEVVVSERHRKTRRKKENKRKLRRWKEKRTISQAKRLLLYCF